MKWVFIIEIWYQAFAAAARSWASTTATALMFTMPRAVTEGARMCTGRDMPIKPAEISIRVQ